ncbi:MAG: hypothetical protein CYG59_21275 [Chloroflexi bacterium]|nr:MAG: hypothetical protein CYG59_21275 [Chloroflexota bacterium]
MPDIPQVGDLQVSQDLDFQERSWRVQRIGWTIFSLILLAAFVGLLGGGPLSAASAGGENEPLEVQYARFARHRSPTQIEVKLQPGAVSGDEARVWVDSQYLDGVELQNIVPEPDSAEAAPDRMIYVFKVNQGDQPTSITFNVMPERAGVRKVRVGLDGGATLNFRQIVYP